MVIEIIFGGFITGTPLDTLEAMSASIKLPALYGIVVRTYTLPSRCQIDEPCIPPNLNESIILSNITTSTNPGLSHGELRIF